jgi:MOSC domain-containing protein YiiM
LNLAVPHMIQPLVEHIHIASAAGQPMESVHSVHVRPGIGLAGDRYASGCGHYSDDRHVSRELTLVEREAIDELRLEHGIRLEPGDTRRNITTRGVDLNGLVGRRFFLGDVLCVGTRVCNPCQYLADLLHKPVVRPLVGRGGLRADLLTEGRIYTGDPIRVAAASQLVIGTTNPEKARQCELALAGLDVHVHRLSEVAPNVPVVEEQSWDARQNARDKAAAYAVHTNLPVVSIDFALFFDGVPDELQPGAMVHRIRGSDAELDDDRVIRHYSALIARFGGELKGEWRVAFALAARGSMTDAEVVVRRTFVSHPSSRRKPGYPLASLQLASDSVYVSELGEDLMAYPELAQPLRRFVAGTLSRR